jgi:glutaredoxin-related protein
MLIFKKNNEPIIKNIKIRLGRVTQNFQLVDLEKSRTNLTKFISHKRLP